VLVVAADDGSCLRRKRPSIMARAAEVPIIVAVNKIDKPEADLERVTRELRNFGLAPRRVGRRHDRRAGVAKTRQGIPQLLEMLLLQSDVLELTAGTTAGRAVHRRGQAGPGSRSRRHRLVQEGTFEGPVTRSSVASVLVAYSHDSTTRAASSIRLPFDAGRDSRSHRCAGAGKIPSCSRRRSQSSPSR